MIVSCQPEQAEQAVDINPFEKEFIAEREGSTALSRTIRMSDGRVFWSPADKVSIFCADDANGGDCFVTQNDSPSASAVLKGTFSSGASDPGTVWAVYPYSTDNVFDGEDLTLTVPSVQTAVAGTFAADCFPAVARSDSDRLGFKNLCGGIKFTVSRDDIVSVSFKGNNNEVLAGRVKVSLFYSGASPYLHSVTDKAYEVELRSSDSPLTPGVWYYMAMIPTPLFDGFTLCLTTKDGNRFELHSENYNSIKRSVFGTINDIDKTAHLQLSSIEPVSESVQYHWGEFNAGTLVGSDTVLSYEGNSVTVTALNAFEAYRSFSVNSTSEIEYIIEPAEIALEDYEWSIGVTEEGVGSYTAFPKLIEVKKNEAGRLVVSYRFDRSSRFNTDADLSFLLYYRRRVDDILDYKTCTPVKLNIVKDTAVGLPETANSTAAEAIANSPQVTIPYTGTAVFDLNSLGEIALDENNEEVSIKELVAKYGFSLYAMLIPTQQENSTYSEDQFCTFKQNDQGEWVLTPAYFDKSVGAIVEVEPGNYLMGAEAIGHSPVVALFLRNELNYPFLVKFIRVMIVDDPDAKTGEVLSGFGTKDFVINQLTIPQTHVVHEVFAADNDIRLMNQGLGMAYGHFRQSFSCDDKTYVKNEYGRFEESDKYGTIAYQKVTTAPCSDSFVIDTNPTHMKEFFSEPGYSKVLYKRFVNNSGDCVYIGIKVVLEPFYVSFSMHDPAYWFNDIDQSIYNTLHFEVPLPTYWRKGDIPGSIIINYHIWLRTGWKDNKITINPKATGLDVELEWSFADSREQPVIDGKRLTVSSDGSELLFGSDPVLLLDWGYLTYCDNDTAKELLNKWPSTSIKTSEMLYCKVYLRAYGIYNDTDVSYRSLIGEEAMYYRFRRPLEMEARTDSYLTDGLPGVDFVTIGDLFMLKGLSKQYPLFEKSGDTFQAVPYPKPENFQVDLYGYFNIQSMSFDRHEIKTDLNGNRELFSSALPSAMVWLAEKDYLHYMMDSSNVDISDPASLGKYVICYANTMPSNRDFNLYIPFTVTYAWGDLTGELVIPVHTY